MEIGTRVRIREDSNYFGQCDEIGVVAQSENLESYMTVNFPNGYSNTYRVIDLDIVEPVIADIPIVEGEMIDRKLVREAAVKSEVIKEIEACWRNRCNTLLKGIKKLPFDGNYEAFVSGNNIYVKGYEGNLAIKKVYHNRITYSINPITIVKDFKLYGKYSKESEFFSFIGTPSIGCHFTGHTLDGTYGNLCTGDLEYNSLKSIDELKRTCMNAIKSLEIINMSSLGKILPPKRKNKFWTIMVKLTPETIEEIVHELIAEGCIKQLL